MRLVTSSNGARHVSTASSLGALSAQFRAAAEPALGDLVGRHRAEMAGPFWMRLPAPLFLAVTGMPGWVGKEFASPDSPDADELVGHNLIDDRGVAEPSLPMRARVATSRLDGRAAAVLTYAPDAPFPWRNVVDEVRPLADGRLLGISYNIVPGVPVGVPFLLHHE